VVVVVVADLAAVEELLKVDLATVEEVAQLKKEVTEVEIV